MTSARLAELAQHDGDQLIVRIYGRRSGELVLADPSNVEERTDLHELTGVECLELVAATTQGAPLVVEALDGDYLVLPDADPDEDRHLPLALPDVEVLTGPAAALGRFGRRSDDLVPLTPWAPDHLQIVFDPGEAAFVDVPVVVRNHGQVTVERGALSGPVLALVREHLAERDEEGRFGVLLNAFGEYAVHEVGDIIEPHHDLRRSTIVDLASLVEGLPTLSDLATRLRLLADRMEAAEDQGWTLLAPVADGYAYPERSDV